MRSASLRLALQEKALTATTLNTLTERLISSERRRRFRREPGPSAAASALMSYSHFSIAKALHHGIQDGFNKIKPTT